MLLVVIYLSHYDFTLSFSFKIVSGQKNTETTKILVKKTEALLKFN